jgi:chromosomal replication initiator protein
LELAEESLKDQLIGHQKQEINLPFIQQIVAKHYNISIEDMKGRKRTQSIVFPRQIAMYLSRKILDVSLPECGKQFGGRDHSTVIHSCDKISAELDGNQDLQNVLNELERRIKGE